jgi:hydrophobic/amphiphilic exporter-1 (mainly G- bacteria), HAE1 family
MNISETCIRRPVMTTLVSPSPIVFGFFAYTGAFDRGTVPSLSVAERQPSSKITSLPAAIGCAAGVAPTAPLIPWPGLGQ